jgi:hypothetical protein
MNPASQLGKMAAGVPKKFSASELAKRKELDFLSWPIPT